MIKHQNDINSCKPHKKNIYTYLNTNHAYYETCTHAHQREHQHICILAYTKKNGHALNGRRNCGCELKEINIFCH